MGFLAHQFPNEEIQYFEGSWIASTLDQIPESCFFITDFTKDKVYYFKEHNTLENLSNIDFSFSHDDEIFVANEKAYLNGLQYFIDGFELFGIEKAIFSRIKLVDREADVELNDVFVRLCKAYQKQALVYFVSDEQFGSWMGATPETLLSGNEQKMQSMALAGTKSSAEKEWTEKEFEEQQYVVDYIQQKIEEQSPGDLSVTKAQTVQKGAVYHLQSDFEFSLDKEKWNALLQSLHPTPAVCGTPGDLARDYILRNEPHERSFYTGIIGQKKSDALSVYVNLRCMQVMKKHFALYVGGGITLSSNIANELQETEDKSETLLSVIFD